jgi:hypothetical protein
MFAGLLRNMKLAQEMGISPVIEIGKHGEGDFFSSLAADKKKRMGFINFLYETLDRLPHVGGFFIRWLYPGCPNVNVILSVRIKR